MGTGARGGKRTGFWRLLWSRLAEGGRLLDRGGAERRDAESALVDTVAREVSREGFGAAAILVAESAKPLSRIGSHALHLMTPSIGLMLGEQRLQNLACLLENRENLERFVSRLEELEEKRGASPRRPR